MSTMALWLVIQQYAQITKRRKVAEATVILLECLLNFSLSLRTVFIA
jgi:hypothetical protein